MYDQVGHHALVCRLTLLDMTFMYISRVCELQSKTWIDHMVQHDLK